MSQLKGLPASALAVPNVTEVGELHSYEELGMHEN